MGGQIGIGGSNLSFAKVRRWSMATFLVEIVSIKLPKTLTLRWPV